MRPASLIGFSDAKRVFGSPFSNMAKPSLIAAVFAMSFILLTIPAYAAVGEFTIDIPVQNDTKVTENNDTNQGLSDLEMSRQPSTNNDWRRSYMRFNLTDFFNSQSPISILYVNLTMIQYWVLAPSAELEFSIFNVTDTQASKSWREYDTTSWTIQPCGNSRVTLNASCNPIALDSAPDHPAYPASELPLSESWNVTSGILHLVGSPTSDKSVTFLLAFPQNLAASRYGFFNSKENVTGVPTLTITYTAEVPPEPQSFFTIIFIAVLSIVAVIIGVMVIRRLFEGNAEMKTVLETLFAIIIIIFLIGIGFSFL